MQFQSITFDSLLVPWREFSLVTRGRWRPKLPPSKVLIIRFALGLDYETHVV
jgi:hypothetical protein